MNTITIFIAVHTDLWQGNSSRRMIGFDLSLEEAIELAKQDEDAVADVKEENGQIVIYECNSGELDDFGIQVFATCNDDARELILGKEIEA